MNEQTIEENIDTLIAEWQKLVKPPTDAAIALLGKWCGMLAVEVGYDPDHSRIEAWEPADGDIDALNELFGYDPYDEGDEEGDRVMDLFCQSYHEGVRESVQAVA